VAFFTLLLAGVREKRIAFQKSILDIPLLLLLGWVTLSLLWTPSAARGVEHYLRILAGFATYFFTINLIRTRNDYQFAVIGFLVVLVVFCFFGIYELLTEGVKGAIEAVQGPRLKVGGVQAVKSAAGDALGYLLNIGFIVAIPLYFTTVSKRLKSFTFIAIIIMSLGMIAAFSRKSWVALFVVIVFLGMRHKRILLLSMLLFFITAIFVYLAGPPELAEVVYKRFSLIFVPAEVAIPSRIVTWRAILEMVGETPVIGHGVGSFFVLSEETGSPLVRAHNLALYLLMDLGLIGLVLYMFLLIMLLSGFYEFSKRCIDERTRFILRGYGAGFLLLLIQGGFRTLGLYDRIVWVYFGLTVVFLGLFFPSEEEKYKPTKL